MDEQKLRLTGLVNLASAKNIGELLGADIIIVGTLRDLGETVDVTARLVALESGTGLSAAQGRIAKTAVVTQQLAQVFKPAAGATAQAVSVVDIPWRSKSDKPFPVLENDAVRIEAVSLGNGEKGQPWGRPFYATVKGVEVNEVVCVQKIQSQVGGAPAEVKS